MRHTEPTARAKTTKLYSNKQCAIDWFILIDIKILCIPNANTQPKYTLQVLCSYIDYVFAFGICGVVSRGVRVAAARWWRVAVAGNNNNNAINSIFKLLNDVSALFSHLSAWKSNFNVIAKCWRTECNAGDLCASESLHWQEPYCTFECTRKLFFFSPFVCAALAVASSVP